MNTLKTLSQNGTPGFEKVAASILFSSFFLFITIAIIYSNTLTADWHLDDYPNIVQNQNLHLNSLDSQSLTQTFFSHPTKKGTLFRPIANLSFALNWYFGGDNVIGYHIFNILLHWATAVLLYLTTIQLLNIPLLQHQRIRAKYSIALLAATLWALNPLQTQAVTYIVQRMAGLATFFYLASLLCYLIGRRSMPGGRMILWFLTAMACFVLALGSKENSITLPLTLLLIEGILFRLQSKLDKRHIFAILGLIGLATAAVYLLTNGIPFGGIAGFEQRSFTLTQRLLTENRILVFYLSQLFFPAPHRLSLTHDITLSTSLLTPPTTLLAMAFLFLLTIWSLYWHKSRPLASFAILFFLLNHGIESSFLPLELIFEHRNYLPSLFLFLPLAALLIDAYYIRLKTTPALRQVLMGAVLLTICGLAVATYSRNAIWLTEQSLWEDSLTKAPGQSRPYINLAHTYQQLGRNQEAFELCQKSLDKSSPTPSKDKARAYNNMGNIVMDWGMYTEAINYYSRALKAYETPFSRYYLHKALLANNQIDKSQNELQMLMQESPNDIELMTSMGIIFAARHELSQANLMLHAAVEKSGERSYERGIAQACLGSVLSRQGNFKDAEAQFREAFSYSEPRFPLLCLIGNHLLQGNGEAAAAQLSELYKHFTTKDLLSTIQTANRQNILFPVEAKELAELIGSQLPTPSTTNSSTQ
ncbi:tetratricopeptide repeat protein [uncultured Desulfobulbus sp.]|uniref:tetratricopeptide repeat protein n=1 Tax=uncultured Desulfobulbus sp. TaxID=239745 RepID=UPI0029C8932A|nr:tetratricopeptide repeat protein [uncultured Desulfobulbus sp.]